MDEPEAIESAPVRSLLHWQLRDVEPGVGLPGPWQDDGWLDVALPGDVYGVLHHAGRIPDPHADRAEEACRWVAEREWWWRTVFTAAPPAADERLILILHGLDTFASIWLNGAKIGEADNMFLGLEIDIGSMLVAEGANTLELHFEPVARRLAGRVAPAGAIFGAPLAESKRNLVRKAQFGWGWDWGPRLPTVGIWRPVEIRRQRIAGLDSLHFGTVSIDSESRRARVFVAVEATRLSPHAVLTVDVELADDAGNVVLTDKMSIEGGESSVRREWDLDGPQLWWTRDLGAPARYRLCVRLKDADGALLDERRQRVGVRTIELDTSADPDEAGCEFFRFKLNGRPIFAKGSCWVPAHSLVGIVGERHYRPLLEAAVEANMNMIRVWGGGVYEHDAFYDLCDELGLLVWQDFMFACAPYPDNDPAFVASVDAEVRYQIRRLRSHPSMALWCGNNENLAIHQFGDAIAGTTTRLAGTLYYEQLMPAAVAELDAGTPYWPGSPYGGAHANSMRKGDVHDWTVWHGIPPVPDDRPVGDMDRSPEGVAYQRYAEDQGRFISEFGIQASPVMETLARCLPADQMELNSPALLNRIKDVPKNKIDALLVSVTGLPQSVQEYVDFTMITQAEGLKFGIEHFRRRKPHCSGTLVWQHNDCWPGISWSLLDFYGFRKAGFHFVKRAYSPVLASFKPLDDGGMELWLTNDRAMSVSGRLTIELIDLMAGVIWTEALQYRVGDNASRRHWTGSVERLGASPERVLRVRCDDGRFPSNRYFFAAIKDLHRDHRSVPQVTVECTEPGGLRVTLTAFAYLYGVHLLVPYEDARIDDNYFDMAPGEQRTLTIRDPGRVLRIGDLTVRSF